MKSLTLMKALVFSLLLTPFLSANAENDADPSVICFSAINSNPDLKILQNKIALVDQRAQTLEMLANEKKPNKAEKIAISLWVDETEKCKQVGDDWRARNMPAPIVSLIDQSFAWLKPTAADLYGGKITFGEFAKARTAQFTKFTADLSEIVQKLKTAKMEQQDKDAKDDEKHAAERAENEKTRRSVYEQQQAQLRAQAEQARMQDDQARRNAALMFLSNQPRPYQIPIQQMPQMGSPSINTNCYTMGNQTNCTSR